MCIYNFTITYKNTQKHLFSNKILYYYKNYYTIKRKDNKSDYKFQISSHSLPSRAQRHRTSANAIRKRIL